MLHYYSDRIKCKVFRTTLVKRAQQRYNQLEPGTITSFKDFSEVFLHQFTGSETQENHSVYSMRMENESLREFLKWVKCTDFSSPNCLVDVIPSTELDEAEED